jgi:hypothetical protein
MGDVLDEHRLWAGPESAFAVERLVNDEGFKGLGVPGETEDAILVALVMPVKTGAGFSGKRRQ